jgi:ketosteroid isomerase-like protein
MSQENVEVVRRAIGALNAGDSDDYLACCTDDVEIRHVPLAPSGPYEGGEGIRRYFADIQDAMPDFRIDIERVEALGADRTITFLLISASGRASGVPLARGLPSATVHDFTEGKISRVRIFLDRQEALEAVGLRE